MSTAQQKTLKENEESRKKTKNILKYKKSQNETKQTTYNTRKTTGSKVKYEKYKNPNTIRWQPI